MRRYIQYQFYSQKAMKNKATKKNEKGTEQNRMQRVITIKWGALDCPLYRSGQQLSKQTAERIQNKKTKTAETVISYGSFCKSVIIVIVSATNSSVIQLAIVGRSGEMRSELIVSAQLLPNRCPPPWPPPSCICPSHSVRIWVECTCNMPPRWSPS